MTQRHQPHQKFHWRVISIPSLKVRDWFCCIEMRAVVSSQVWSPSGKCVRCLLGDKLNLVDPVTKCVESVHNFKIYSFIFIVHFCPAYTENVAGNPRVTECFQPSLEGDSIQTLDCSRLFSKISLRKKYFRHQISQFRKSWPICVFLFKVHKQI